MGRPKRNILAAAEESMTPPDELAPYQSIARVGKPEGNSLYTCTLPNTKPVLVELPTRFRNTIWIKRGGFVLVDLTPSEEQQKTNRKYDGEIINVVRDEKQWRKQAYWYVCLVSLFLNVWLLISLDGVSLVLVGDDDEDNSRDLPPSDSEDDV